MSPAEPSRAAWRLRAGLLVHRHGFGPFVALALVVAGTLGWAWLLWPGRDAVATSEPGVVPALAPEAEGLAGLRRALVPPAQVNPALQRVLDEARHAGLALGRVDYRWPEAREALGGRVQLGVPARGSYPQLKRFVAAAMAVSPGVSLDHWTMRRAAAERADAEDGDALEAMLWFSVWSAGAGEP